VTVLRIKKVDFNLLLYKSIFKLLGIHCLDFMSDIILMYYPSVIINIFINYEKNSIFHSN